METLLQDIRYSFRLMIKNPGFTAVAVLTLALGIGANTAMFSVINAVLLRPLPFPNSHQLVKIRVNNPGVGLRDVPFSYPEFDDIRKSGVFEEVSVVWPSPGNLTGSKQPERLELLAISPNYFSMLGAVPQLGRLFGDQDVAPGFAPGAVISDRLWRQSYGADPAVIGQHLQIDNDPYSIIGVLRPDFRDPVATFAGDVEVWLAAGFSADPFGAGRSQREIVGAIGRLNPGMTMGNAQAKLDALAASVQKDYASDYSPRAKWSVEIQPLQESLVGGVRSMLWVLMGAVVVITVITSVNIANLLLARAAGRQREVSVRLALGANRKRLLRQMLTESMLLAFVGGMIGLFTATLSLGSIVHILPSRIPRLNEVRLDWTVLFFAFLVSVLTSLLFGLVPAIQSTHASLVAGISEGSKNSGYSSKTGRLRGLLIMSEAGLAVVLMVGAGLLFHTFWRLIQQNPGFNPANVVAASIWLPAPNNPKTDKYGNINLQGNFLRDLLRHMNAIPGVETAAVTSVLPASSSPTSSAQVSIVGQTLNSSSDTKAEIIRVTPGYFNVMQTTLIRGRFFIENDQPDKQPVVIVDESTAHRYWQQENPIDKQIKIGPPSRAVTAMVVGEVSDIKHDGLDKDGVPHIYAPAYQRGGKVLNLVLRTSLSASTLEPQIRREVWNVDPSLPVVGVRNMDQVISAGLAPRRFSMQLIGIFALLALVLACTGVYGVLAYMVGQRSHEIGLRMALGAQPANILKLILTQGALLASGGIVGGLILAGMLAPFIASLVYGIHVIDPIVFISVPLVLLTVALLASIVPALRAARLNPIETLRES